MKIRLRTVYLIVALVIGAILLPWVARLYWDYLMWVLKGGGIF